MRAINYKSDFDFIPKLKDRNGKEVRFPDCDWEAVLWVSNKANNYKVSRKGEQYTNCFVEENGDVHFVVNGHHLGIGVLKWDLHVALPNEIYPDGLQHLCWPESLDIELVAGAGDCPTTAELEAMLPYIKGEPFTYDDFTPEQIAELQKPATDAAASVSELETNIQETEALRKDAEQTRISNENSRTSAENDRVRDENIRKANETSRQSDETSRQSNETARVEAETARAEEFAAWQGEIDSKADRSELSNALRKTEQALTPSEQAQVKKNLGISKMELFVDMWNTACGSYGKYAPANAPDPEHPFYLNELWLTYEEALTIFERGVWRFNSMPAIDGTNVKTNLFAMSLCDHFDRANDMGGFDLSRFVRANQSIETLRVSTDDNEDAISNGYAYGLTVKSINNMFFSGTHNLFKKMFGVIDLRRVVEPWKLSEGTLPELTTFLLTRVRCSFDISCAPKISLDSINYWITAAINASAITITVHPDVYAKLTGDITNAAAADLTAEEAAQWQALAVAAGGKQITFATTN